MSEELDHASKTMTHDKRKSQLVQEEVNSKCKSKQTFSKRITSNGRSYLSSTRCILPNRSLLWSSWNCLES